MKTIFVVNPQAGHGDRAEAVMTAAGEAGERLGEEVECYLTQSVGDATEFVRGWLNSHPEEEARFVACGGDGTVNEVLNGLIGHPKAMLGIMPIGSGNDFCRNFPGADFLNAEAQLKGEGVRCDAIRYTSTTPEGLLETRYCVNMFNIGFDCNVVDATSHFKGRKFISGSMAYFLGILTTMIRKKGADLRIVADGEEKQNGKLMLTSIANGQFCGGGIRSNPTADVHDGTIDLNIVYDVPRRRFVTLLPKYMKGTHVTLKNIGQFSLQCRKITVEPLEGSMRVCIDGETGDSRGLTLEAVRDAFTLSVPPKKG